MSTPAIVVALRVERAALRGRTGAVEVIRTGVGPKRAARIRVPYGCVSSGLCGGLAAVRPGEVVVAEAIIDGERRVSVPRATELADALRDAGLVVHVGAVAASDHIVHGTERAALAERGALAVDMESGALAALSAGSPFALARVVLDTPDRPLLRLGTPIRALRALRTLRRAGPVLAQWSRARGAENSSPAPREVA